MRARQRRGAVAVDPCVVDGTRTVRHTRSAPPLPSGLSLAVTLCCTGRRTSKQKEERTSVCAVNELPFPTASTKTRKASEARKAMKEAKKGDGDKEDEETDLAT